MLVVLVVMPWGVTCAASHCAKPLINLSDGLERTMLAHGSTVSPVLHTLCSLPSSDLSKNLISSAYVACAAGHLDGCALG